MSSSHPGLRGKTIEEAETRSRNAVPPLFFPFRNWVRSHQSYMYTSPVRIGRIWKLEAGGGGERPVTGRTQVLVAAEK